MFCQQIFIFYSCVKKKSPCPSHEILSHKDTVLRN